MIFEDYPVLKSVLGFQFQYCFDTEGQKFGEFCNGENCVFSHMSYGCYYATNDKCKYCKYHTLPDAAILRIAKKEEGVLYDYQRKLRERVHLPGRNEQDVFTVGFTRTPIKTVSYDGVEQKLKNVYLHGFVTFQKIGVGLISLWAENFEPKYAKMWYKAQNPDLITIELNDSHIMKKHWVLSELARYIALLSYSLRNNFTLSKTDIADIIKTEETYSNFLNSAFSKRGLMPVSSAITNHPFFYMQYDFCNKEMEEKLKESGAELRLLLYGDSNWKAKTDEVIDKMVTEDDLSFEKSVDWWVTKGGTVKITSNELEMSNEESVAALLIETEIIFSMKFFLTDLSGRLSDISDNKLTPAVLADIRHKIFNKMDDYYNMDICSSDLMQNRLGKLKEMFSIDTLYNDIMEKIDMLEAKITLKTEEKIQKQQNLMTIIFGFFTSLGVFFNFFSTFLSGTKGEIELAVVFAILGSLFVVIGIVGFSRVGRKRR